MGPLRTTLVGIATGVALVVLLAAGGCSLLLPFDDECTADEECAAKGAGLRCVQRLCVTADISVDTGDAATTDVRDVGATDVPSDTPPTDVPADIPADLDGTADVADVRDVPADTRPDADTGLPDEVAAPDVADAAETTEVDAGPTITPDDLIAGPCARFYGYGVTLDQALSDDVILIGAILPFTGQLGIMGPFLDQAVELAVKEINQGGGLRGKSFAVLSCDSGTNPETTLAAASHLVNVARVPAIIGPVSSELTLLAYSRVTAAAEVVLVSPVAASPVMASLDSGGLVWRTAGSNLLLAATIADHLIELDLDRIGAVNRDDTWGNAMREAIETRYCAVKPCDPAHYLPRSYSTSDYETSQSEVLAEMTAFAPDATVLISYILDGAAFLRGATVSGLPRIITPDGLQDKIALALVPPEDNAEVLCRLFGVSAQRATEAFRIRYATAYGQDPIPYTGNAYDAAYVTAFAIAAVWEEGTPLTGRAIGDAMLRVTSGPAIDPGSTNWNRGVQLLRASDDATIDYVGVSGPVDFDPATGGVDAAVEGWQFNLTTGGPEFLGVVYTLDDVYQPPDYGLAAQDPICAPFRPAR